ncbi:28S ribosomal protein S18b, mitochondrial-like isoform X2 [Portunus trituberculatus]|uniref:28S ribosomal protein S18b, mitochondrial-like isoform X2 n=1 Tax=Portunus trituberculatus TaxID=210409 RepID=UPI001E1CB0E3|nr:28S ribosomal protein S18b, mitochondrial-like isoform X2 [Portunus trituberculatus]
MLAGLLRTGVGGRQLIQGWRRGVSMSGALRCEATDGEEEEGQARKQIDPAKDRTRVIPVETSLKYMQSEAYQTAYGDDPVWKKYKRNFKGQFPPKKTRKLCIRAGVLSTGNPCPVCRDEYLVLDPRNTALLKQFISPHNNGILPTSITNLCRKRHRELEVAVQQARDIGLLTYDVPFRRYNYQDYYPLASSSSSSSTTASATSSSSACLRPPLPLLVRNVKMARNTTTTTTTTTTNNNNNNVHDQNINKTSLRLNTRGSH